jgi:hypothetical protein
MAGWLLPTLGFEIIFMGTAIIIAISIPFSLFMKTSFTSKKSE